MNKCPMGQHKATVCITNPESMLFLRIWSNTDFFFKVMKTLSTKFEFKWSQLAERLFFVSEGRAQIALPTPGPAAFQTLFQARAEPDPEDAGVDPEVTCSTDVFLPGPEAKGLSMSCNKYLYTGCSCSR